MGAPTLGGLAGSVCVSPLVSRLGIRTVLLGAGSLRTCWLALMLFAHPGTGGLITIIAADTALLFCAAVFNPVFTTYRMNATSDAYMVRVGTAWSITAKTCQPAFIAAAGILAAATNTRIALMAAAFTLLASSALLPWQNNPAPQS